MRKISKWVAIDGTEFHSDKNCIDYERLIEKVDLIREKLPTIPVSTDFMNGALGFIQHDKLITDAAWIEFMELCKERIDHKWIQDSIDDLSIHRSYAGRIISEYNIKPFNELYHRFSCLDKDYREWGQPYFAINPGKAECENEIKN